MNAQQPIKVSVIMPTYNHKRFIKQALLSAINQKTDFRYEILVGEDGSSDGTREIVKQLAAEYPDLIRPFYNSRENVIYINGRATGRWNFINLMEHAQGEHIAILEGDDYWLVKDKLQKQVNYLEEHKECGIIFHNVILDDMDPDLGTEVQLSPNFRTKSDIEDLLKKNFIPSCSVLYRNNLIKTLPEWYIRAPTGDWPLHVLNAKQGNIDYLPELMGAYRQHKGGYWNSIKNQTLIPYLYDLQFYQFIQTELPDNLMRAWQKSVIRSYYKITKELSINGNSQRAILYKEYLKQNCDSTLKYSIYLIKIDFWRLVSALGLTHLSQYLKNLARHKIRNYWWKSYNLPDSKSNNPDERTIS